MSGWIKDFRQEIESDIWLMPPMYHRVWQWLKYSVNHSEGKIPNKDGTFTIIHPGQRATSYRQIAKGVGYYEGRKWKEPNVKTIKSILDWLVSQNMISVQGNTLGTIVSIENWAVYQSEIVQGNSKRITQKHLLDTNKNDKEELKNDNIKPLCDESSDSPPGDVSKAKIIKYPEGSTEYEAAKYIRSCVLEFNPNAKLPDENLEDLQKWADDVRKIIRLDERQVEDLKTILRFIFKKDDFWCGVIQSPSGLRRNWDKVWGKMISKGKRVQNQSVGGWLEGLSQDQEFQEWLESEEDIS